jgi:subtilisin-like proprotein convertase family protein
VIDQTGLSIKYVARPDGVFEVTAQVGDKLEMSMGGLTTAHRESKFSQVVPPSAAIDLFMTGRAPSNDFCDDAIPVDVPSITAGTTDEATIDDEQPFCGTGITSPGVWYTVIGTGNEMTATTCDAPGMGGSATFDTKISVYCADCDDGLCVGGNDDSCSGGTSGLRSTVTWCSQAGVTYRILVHAFGGQSGDFDLSVFESGGSCQADVDCLPPVPVGACCTCLNPPYNCSIDTVDQCLALGGVPRGAGTICNPGLGEPVVYETFPDEFIPSNATISDTITVTDSFSIGDVNVDLGITHTWIGDLDVIIEHNGVSLSIWDRRCSDSDNIMATADDEGTETLCSVVGAGPINDVFYSPEVAGLGLLSVFDGMDSAGDWTLTITDNVGGDDGTLNQWSLHIDGVGTPACEQNVTVCHVPDDGDPHTIVVGESSVPSHLNHGDTLGPCEGAGESTGSFGRH